MRLLHRTLAVVASATLAIGLAACSSSSGTAGNSTQGATNPGTATSGSTNSSGTTSGSSDAVLRIGTNGSVQSLNPFVSTDTLTLDFDQAMYPFLVQHDLKTSELAPDLATSWKVGDSGRKITFDLTKNATWSDGKPLTAADAAWTLNLMVKYQKGPAAVWASAVAGMTKAVAVNDTTLEIDYDTPLANAIALVSQIPILPKQFWGQYATGNGKQLTKVKNQPSSGKPMVSGGPFVFVKYVKGQAALFKTNAKYWGRKPHIAGFGVQFFSNDDAEVSALTSGQIDVAMGNPALPATDVAPIKKAGLRVYTGPSVSFNDLIINTNSSKTKHRELLNPKVREAIEYATDRKQIINTVLLGYGTPGASIIPPSTGAWHDDSVKPLPFDLAKANSLLDQAGYKKGSGGIRIADGHPMSYNLLIPPDVVGGLRTGQLMSQDFAKIGIKVNVKQLDDDALEEAITKNHYRDFDLAMWGWDTTIDPSYMLSAMTCAQYGNNNDSGYCNADYDKMYAQQAGMTDRAARQALVYTMQQKIFNDRPYVVLYYLDVLEGWSKDWNPVTEGPTGFLSQISVSPLLDISKK